MISGCQFESQGQPADAFVVSLTIVPARSFSIIFPQRRKRPEDRNSATIFDILMIIFLPLCSKLMKKRKKYLLLKSMIEDQPLKLSIMFYLINQGLSILKRTDRSITISMMQQMIDSIIPSRGRGQSPSIPRAISINTAGNLHLYRGCGCNAISFTSICFRI